VVAVYFGMAVAQGPGPSVVQEDGRQWVQVFAPVFAALPAHDAAAVVLKFVVEWRVPQDSEWDFAE